MPSPPIWIRQQPDGPRLRWDEARLASLPSRARLAQGKVLGATRFLDAGLTLEAVATILAEEGLTTSAIEGERFDPAALRSSVARRLGRPTAGLPTPPRVVAGLTDVLLDATRHPAKAYLITPFSQPPPSQVSAMGPGVQAQGARKRGRAGVRALARAFLTAGPRAGLQRVIRKTYGWPGSWHRSRRQPPQPRRPRPVRDGPFEMVELPGGAFLMGSPDDDTMANDDERPQHQVQVSGFRIARTPVTRAVYEPVMAREVKGKDAAGGDLPATRVTWEDAIAFCNRLSRAHGHRPCYHKRGVWRRRRWRCDWWANGYRLPTEAEWEYACRAGTQSRYGFGDDPARLGDYAWFRGCQGTGTLQIMQLLKARSQKR